MADTSRRCDIAYRTDLHGLFVAKFRQIAAQLIDRAAIYC
jgi:hypothetical protein